MRTLIFAFLIYLTSAHSSVMAADAKACRDLVPQSKIQVTSDFISYVERLFDLNVIQLDDLIEFQMNLENNKIVSPLASPGANTFSINLIHSIQLNNFINSGELDSAQLQVWINEKIKLAKTEKKEREEKQKEAKNIWTEMSFVTVPGDDFEFESVLHTKPYYDSQTFKIKMPTFETMSTHVTQKMWLEVMGDLPDFRDQTYTDYAVKLKHNGKLFSLYPDAPVTYVSWWSMLAFANEVSKLHGLEPAYDLDDIVFQEGTSAAKGDLALDASTQHPNEVLVKFNSKSGVYHEATGYRLPSYVEKRYLLNYLDLMASPETSESKMGDQKLIKDANNWGWFNTTSLAMADSPATNVGTHPHPLEINGQPLHDFMGNVVEMLFDGAAAIGYPLSEKQLIFETNRGYRKNFGVLNDPYQPSSTFQTIYTRSPLSGYGNIGFRLSRTLSPEEVTP